jgi:hypothetical protein
MKSLRIKTFRAVCVAFMLFSLNAASKAQSSGEPEWGEAVDGVQMSISDAGLVKPGVPKLVVTFRNTRSEDVDLFLGIIGGSGPRPCLLDGRSIVCNFNFTLELTDAAGATRRLRFKGAVYVAGRLDPYVVWLRAGTTHELELGLDQFYSPDTREYEFRPPRGRYRIALEFEGRGPEPFKAVNRLGQKLNFWKGRLRSNTLTIKDGGRARAPKPSHPEAVRAGGHT